jgi:hypothetical protein
MKALLAHWLRRLADWLEPVVQPEPAPACMACVERKAEITRHIEILKPHANDTHVAARMKELENELAGHGV